MDHLKLIVFVTTVACFTVTVFEAHRVSVRISYTQTHLIFCINIRQHVYSDLFQKFVKPLHEMLHAHTHTVRAASHEAHTRWREQLGVLFSPVSQL